MKSKTFNEHHPLLVAEIAQAHEGSLGIAEAYIQLAKECGADFIKFQTHLAQYESSPLEPWRVKFSQQDNTRYSYWERMEFSVSQWKYLSKVASDTDIKFMSSPFSVEAVDLLEQLNVPIYKIASGEIENTPMLEKIKTTKKPVIISTGLSSLDDVDRLVEFFSEQEICILHCVSEYPTAAENANLHQISVLKERYKDCAIGLSDHSGTIYPALMSLHLGLSLIEVHLTFHKGMFGPDITSSLNEDQFKTLKNGIEFYERTKRHKERKNRQVENMKKIFGRSSFLKVPLRAGQELLKTNLIMKKPALGLPYADALEYVGKRAIRDIDTDTPIQGDFFE